MENRRGYGKTTSQILRAVSDAMANPGTTISFVDHYKPGEISNHNLAIMTKNIIKN